MTKTLNVTQLTMTVLRLLIALDRGAILRAEGFDRKGWLHRTGSLDAIPPGTIKAAIRAKLITGEFGRDSYLHYSLTATGREAVAEAERIAGGLRMEGEAR